NPYPSDSPLFDQTAQGQQNPAPDTRPTGSMDASTVQQMIDQALARQQETHDQELATLRGQIGAAQTGTRAVTGDVLIPLHAGGPGERVHETWSQHDQEL